MIRKILHERNLVVILFVMVFIIFSLAQEDTRKIERMYQDSNPKAVNTTNEAQKEVLPANTIVPAMLHR